MRLFKWNDGGIVMEREIPEAHPRPMLESSALVKEHVVAMQDEIADYAAAAKAIGFTPPDLSIEAFKQFLVRHDLPVFALTEVVAYMDKKAADEAKEKAGWHWCPLRDKDDRYGLAFGREGAGIQEWGRERKIITPASDFYRGPAHIPAGDVYDGGHVQHVQAHDAAASAKPYAWTVPIHALKKVALIEREFKGDNVDVAFFVCDYAPAPAPRIVYPDPFLMAVIPNPLVDKGLGRFVLDFWDEPGFGIDKQVRSY